MQEEANPKQEEQERPPAGGFPQTLAECHAVIASQASRLDELAAQVSLLNERLKLDSRNSSKPPSSDGPAGGNRAQRRASARKRGAQKGHQGHYRALVDGAQVDQVVECKPIDVCECGAEVQVLGDEPIRHQVFDVPPVQAQVNEYQRFAGRCQGCGKAHRGALLRISAIVDACFSLIVDGETALWKTRRGGAQAQGLNVAQSSTIRLKRSVVKFAMELGCWLV